MRIPAVVALGLSVLLLSAGCGSSDVELTGHWVPKEVPGLDLGASFDPSVAPIAFTDNGTWAGKDGCYPVKGTYQVSVEKFSSSSTVSGAQVACANGEVPYADLLGKATRVKDSEKDLRFETDDGTLVLELTPAK
ncbi:META domain-containing protein [Marmoricola sp. RAF53]|uniref:META domain-containing protein n=1 Tax=Marmoricola sp. RAF53 TaxID=3233059 RepID=UPI003F94EAB2